LDGRRNRGAPLVVGEIVAVWLRKRAQVPIALAVDLIHTPAVIRNPDVIWVDVGESFCSF
jgi:hypothetical protein